jgi:hypothetical protein
MIKDIVIADNGFLKYAERDLNGPFHWSVVSQQ